MVLQYLHFVVKFHANIKNSHFNGNAAAVTASTLPGTGLEMNGNCSHVDVDLNSLKRFENEILTTMPSFVAASI